MRIIKDEPATLKRPRRITVELHHHDEVLMSFRPECYYRLGEPINDVVFGENIITSNSVYWCSLAQGWEA